MSSGGMSSQNAAPPLALAVSSSCAHGSTKANLQLLILPPLYVQCVNEASVKLWPNVAAFPESHCCVQWQQGAADMRRAFALLINDAPPLSTLIRIQRFYRLAFLPHQLSWLWPKAPLPLALNPQFLANLSPETLQHYLQASYLTDRAGNSQC